MGDFGKGLKSFKKSMREEEESEDASFSEEKPKALNSEAARAAEPAKEKDRAAG
jgi:Sec-independent protein translocase protein TatA